MNHLINFVFLGAILFFSNPVIATQTGNFCAKNGTLTLFSCHGGKPGPGWNPVGPVCYHRTTAKPCPFDVNVAYQNIIDKIGWIYSPSSPRRPTNNLASITGDLPYFTYQTNAPINGADMSLGYFLISVYEMYCHKKGLPATCLQRSLYFSFRMTGATQTGDKIIQVNTSGAGSFSSGSFQETISKFYTHLEMIGGPSGITAAEAAVIHPGPQLRAPASISVISSTLSSNANTKWLDQNFINLHVAEIKKLMKNLFTIEPSVQPIVSDAYYSERSQGSLLRSFTPYLQKPGAINTLITGPNTTDSLGRAWMSINPSFFVMRSWFNSPTSAYSQQAITSNSQIYLHELGHNMGLGHCAKNSTVLCTDNLWWRADGPTAILNYLSNSGTLRYSYEF